MPAAMAWPPPFTSSPCATAWRTARPRSTPGMERPELAAAHRDQPLGDEGAVEPLERHHVGDGAEGDQIDEIEEVGLRPRHAPESAAAQLAVDRDDGEEHQPDRGEVAEIREIVEPVRI